MNIFDKIKDFFKRLGNKQKAIESSKEINNETINTVSNTDKYKFLEDLKFDPQDLLDPRICKGDNFVPNILKTLGANEDILKNPKAIERIERQFGAIVRQSGLEMPNKHKESTREEIEKITEAIKSNSVIDIEKRESEYSGRSSQDPQKLNYRLSIDKETGSITLGTFNISGKQFNRTDNYIENTYSPDVTGNVIVNSSYSKITNLNKEVLNSENQTILNSDGIALESETRSYEEIDGENVLKYHNKSTRDEEYPFIEKEEVLKDDISFDKELGTNYRLISLKDLSQLGFPEYKFENGKHEQIKFNNKAEIKEYYQENKENIDNALTKAPDYGLFTSDKLKKSLQLGIKKLSEKAGIYPKEVKKDNEIEK